MFYGRRGLFFKNLGYPYWPHDYIFGNSFSKNIEVSYINKLWKLKNSIVWLQKGRGLIISAWILLRKLKTIFGLKIISKNNPESR